VGREVTFTFRNDDNVPHNFTVSYLDVKVSADPGQSVPVKMTVPTKGTYNFYDAKYQGVGMAGKIEAT
jgi:heme/copper-type cytochrome/quinol oxidase subunit 2